MRLLAPTLCAALLLAGCSDPGDGAGAPTTTTSTTQGPLVEDDFPDPPVAMSLPVELDGNMGTFAHYCVFPADHCETHEVTPGVIDVVVAHPGSNFTGLDLNMTWSSSSPLNDELALGFMVMRDCDCPDPFEDEVRGRSPLRATVSGQDIPLNETTVIHIYVYNPKAFQMLPGGAGYTFSSVDQAFRLEGVVNVVMT